MDVPANLDVQAHYARALDHLRAVQRDDGALAGEVVWNPMLVCQYVIVCYVMGRSIPAARAERIRLSLLRSVRPDGGWGMHPDSDSWLFHTSLGYVALRLLGYDHTDPLVAGAKAWLDRGPSMYTLPNWGRIWMALLGLHPWSSIQPILPELWLLPDAAPLHPRRLYCHMRLIYLGLSFLYGSRVSVPSDPTIEAIRSELFPAGYDLSRFETHREDIADTDLFEAPAPALRAVFTALRGAERLFPSVVRRRALDRALQHILFELRSTGYVCLSPVNGFLFCLALHLTDPRHPELDRALAGMEYWVWEDDVEGTRFVGARSDIWDTSFVLQALCEGPETPRAREIARDACAWLPRCQLLRDIPDGARHYRDPARGGFGFADEHHPWPVSDCTAEAVEALVRCHERGWCDPIDPLPLERRIWALEFILGRQNEDGGFGSYEPRRGSLLLKRFNPAEIYGNCMLEYSYVECSASCVRGLAYLLERIEDDLPHELAERVRSSIARGAQFIASAQHPSGGWLGFWGINITYGTMFAVSGLKAAGVPLSSPSFSKAVTWLIDAQRPDGGWAESWVGMVESADIRVDPSETSSVVQTAWALLALLEIAPSRREAIDRGIRFLEHMQRADGSWPAERATGCFFNTAVLVYDLYRQYFPTWALARYLRTFGASEGASGD